MTRTVFFDLDGTLTDPRPGIVRSVLHALDGLNLPVPGADELDWVIGPPLIESFARLGAPKPEEALALYRERYASVGLFENRVFDGIPTALETLSDRYRLCVATAKPHVYARRITAHFGLARHFAAEFGPELDGTRNDKAELLAHALDRLGLAAEACVMVGDRRHDFDAATAVGMASIAVTWGYGPQDELARAGSVCTRPDLLAAHVISVLG